MFDRHNTQGFLSQPENGGLACLFLNRNRNFHLKKCFTYHLSSFLIPYSISLPLIAFATNQLLFLNPNEDLRPKFQSWTIITAREVTRVVNVDY